jgi:hypothetical protein
VTNPWNDLEREDGFLTEVSAAYKGYYSVTSSTGWSCGVSAEYGVEPKVGDAFVTWGGIGYPIRGQAINGRVLYYRTPDEQELENHKAAEKIRADRVAKYESNRSSHDARVAALPTELRERVEGFRAFRGDAWRYEFEPYELMCCEQAAKLAERFTTTDALLEFAKLEPDQQREAFPEMDTGHSGNSWGQSLLLARMLIERPELVAKAHGALCPLAGCESYGCYAIREAASAEGAL